MRSKRTVILMAILLVLVLGYVARPIWERYRYEAQSSAAQAPLPGKNSVSHLEVQRDQKGRWIASFDYFYTGAPAGAALNIELSRGSDVSSAPSILIFAGGY